MTEQKNDFGVGSVEQNIIRMAVPMTVAQILNLLYNLVDRMYIGHIPGASSLALTGVGITFPIISMITAFANLFGMGGAPLCSMARGRRDYDAAKRYMQNAFWMLLAAGVVLTVTGYVIEKPLLYALGASSVTYSYASSYLRIYLLGNMFVMVGIGMNPFINAQGFGTMGMVTVGLGSNQVILPTIRSQMKANRREIPVLTNAELRQNPEEIGKRGAKSLVTDTYARECSQHHAKMLTGSAAEIAAQIKTLVEEVSK